MRLVLPADRIEIEDAGHLRLAGVGEGGSGSPSAASLPERPPEPAASGRSGRRRVATDTPWGYHRRPWPPRPRGAAPPPDPSHFRHSYTKDTAQLMRRLSRMEGQVRGIARMIEREEYCVDILQQTAALRAAVDALSILVLEDHVQGCVRTAAERGEADSTSTRSSTSCAGRSAGPVRSARPQRPRTDRAGTFGARTAPARGMSPERTGGATIDPYDRPRPTARRRPRSRPPPDDRAAAARSSNAARVPTRRRPHRPRGDAAPRPWPSTSSRPAQPAEARLAGLLDLLADTVGAERAAVVADGDAPGRRRRLRCRTTSRSASTSRPGSMPPRRAPARARAAAASPPRRRRRPGTPVGRRRRDRVAPCRPVAVSTPACRSRPPGR